MPRIEIERFDHEREEDLASESSNESFDRIAFAERAIALVKPPNTRVAICEGRREVEVMVGRNWGHGRTARWAVVCVPDRASRRAIATAVLSLWDGYERNVRAWALDVLMSQLGGGALPLRRFGAPPSNDP